MNLRVHKKIHTHVHKKIHTYVHKKIHQIKLIFNISIL